METDPLNTEVCLVGFVQKPLNWTTSFVGRRLHPFWCGLLLRLTQSHWRGPVTRHDTLVLFDGQRGSNRWSHRISAGVKGFWFNQ